MAINVRASIVINRSLPEVFAFVANFENHPLWEKNFQHVERLRGPDGVGATYRCVFKLPGQRVDSTLQVTEYEPEHRIAFRADRPAIAKPVGTILFTAENAGTRVTLEPRPEMTGLFKLMEPLMAGYIKKNTEDHLQRLKGILEAPQASD